MSILLCELNPPICYDESKKRLLKTAMKKTVLKYNDDNKNTDYLRNKNHRLTSSQKLVPVDNEKHNKSNKSDKSDESNK
ncbi:hypothetical protein C1645_828884 [Glomus cerebriforme]|uniref:Uncharacterized protein n=1 Tax=Glomus cerebriforme TaxID=658196 RepID=A0A397SM36_9GLOM|nr:hypothetical protein C1645_828884 [Glomus cerebriforme]